MRNISRDYHSEHLPTDPVLRRDTEILEGRLTFEDRHRIDKAWTRSIKLGIFKVQQIEARRTAKRGFEV